MDQMRKKILVIICLVILAVLAMGCGKRGDVPAAGPKSCDSLVNYAESDPCYLLMIASEDIRDVAFCDRIVQGGIKEDCYYQIFNKTKETVNCTVIQAAGLRDTCNMVMGIEKMYAAFCDKIINLDKRDNCYYGIASQERFPPEIQNELCNKIYNEKRRNECLKFVDFNDPRY
jgi:hypothetical protein